MRDVFLVGLLVLGACDREEPAAPETPAEEPSEESAAEDGEAMVGPIDASWVEERARAARERMEGDEGGRLVLAALEAHGGLERWLAAGTIEFEFDYQPEGDASRRMHTFERVDLWRAHAMHEELDGGSGAPARFGFNGEEAWITPDADAFPSPARFWALTPYYFVGMPFVVADPGARYEALGQAVLDERPCDLVRVTYEDGTGDAPDDYYVLYLDSETHLLAALRYVVSYPGFFPEGGHTPEKLMRYSEYEEVGGVRLATRYDTYRFEAGDSPVAGVATEKVTSIQAARFALGERYPAALFDPPDGAHISTLDEGR